MMYQGLGIRIYKLNKAGYTAISHVSMPSRASYRVFNFNCNKKNLCSRENLSLLCSFTLEYIEELLDILFSTIANFSFVILLPLKLLFPKLSHRQFPKSDQILKILFRGKCKINQWLRQNI